ncbi:hypothetical protein M427DRAFT_57421 [Gonapodya prolifera JEL478]|uniref:F-box domain-containing protein n=1 Tax=Gonapodya prolifera (strain JEL478) TaxID=1344416 RepID=A0A139AD43_GONPJ|nr:hypothetical protein M427DRAFT_57421 [Gonapodya prolifera JEL478]|eukprot:KXS14504.1 hypothetical protein M427DRAFT_57421 [Gonapodya prolifera JEL478]
MKLSPLEVHEIVFALCDSVSAWSLSCVSRQLQSLSRRPSTSKDHPLLGAESLGRPDRFRDERIIGGDAAIVGQ